MRIRVQNLPTEGQRVVAGLDAAWARAAAAEAIGVDPVALEATFEVGAPDASGRVRVALAVRAEVGSACDRCTEDVTLRLDSSSALDYLPEAPAPSDDADDEVELAEDELDVGWYTDGHLALADILTEALALALPSRIVCDDAAACDARTEALLAAASAGEPGHPAFAALKHLTN